MASSDLVPGLDELTDEVTGAKRGRLKSRKTPYLLLAPGMLWLAIFFVVPMIFLLSQSLQTGNQDDGYTLTFRFANYADAISTYGSIFIRSFVWALVATVLALVIAYPLAYLIAFKAGRWKNVLLVLVIAPFFTSFIIRTLAWTFILSDDGLVVRFLNWSHINDVLTFLQLTSDGRVLATPLAVIMGLTYNFLPFMILPLFASLDRIDPRFLEAATDLYSAPFTAFRKITWPLSLPGVVAGTLLTFIPAAGDYVNAQLLGNPSTRMIGSVIQAKFLSTGDLPAAAALSFTLMVTIVVLVSVYVHRAGTEELV